MTAIAPNTVIRFGTIGLTIDSEDTLFFLSASDQEAHMKSILTNVFTKYTYQREHRNYVKIEITSEQDADKWDYMMFQNTSYGDKWFYAFVTETEWINNLTVKIYYEIDYVQTYWDEYSESPCFIERSHTMSDDIGDNVNPDVYIDDELYTNNDEYVQGTQSNDVVQGTSMLYHVVAYIPSTSSTTVTVFQKIPSGLKLRAFQQGDEQGMTNFISSLGDNNKVVAIYTIPQTALSQPPTWGGEDLAVPIATYNVQLTSVNENMTLNGYHPKNKKMFTYPYNFLRIMTGSGNNMDLRFELFANAPAFQADMSVTMPVQVRLAPLEYDGLPYTYEPGSATYRVTDKKRALLLTDYPQGSWTSDVFSQWLNFQGIPSAIKSIVSPFALFAYSNPNQVSSSGVASAVSLVTDAFMTNRKADDLKGNIASASIDISHDRQHFYCYRMSVKRNIAEQIDNYFTMYGYSINTIDIPSRRNRTHFTYVKTVDCHIDGELPSVAKKSIQDRYNNGIRFWVSDFRDFFVQNDPLM